MHILVPIALFGWPLVAALFFATLPMRRAIARVYLVAWMFLPIGNVDTPFVELDKAASTGLGACLGLFLFARPGSWPPLRVRWADVPMLVWCLCPVATSFANGLGLYDGASAATTRAITWGLPYLLGRTWLRGFEGLNEIARAIFAGGLVYVPLCLLEIRLSPQLHRLVYGEHQHGFLQTFRMGGTFRPMVFMEHGLMLGMFMTAASLVGLALWSKGGVKSLWGVPMSWLVGALVVTTVLCQSFGALLLLAFGAAALYAGPQLRKLLVTGLVLAPLVYLGVRMSGAWDGMDVVRWVEKVDADRAQSLGFRLEQEQVLGEHAFQRPLLGWGGYGRAFPAEGRRTGNEVISDSLWIIALGENGLVGLASVLLAGLAPILVWSSRLAPRWWTLPSVAPAGVMALILGLYVADGMVNMMINPIYLLAAGSLASFVERGRLEPARRAARAPLPAPRGALAAR